MDRLKDKICIVTGGNSGIGEETAKLFARQGATVVITARREAELRRVADEINEAGGRAFYICGDVKVTADVDNVVDQTYGMFGRIDVLVNNAGIPDGHRPAIKMDDDFWDEIHNTDLKGVMRFCRAVLRYMAPANRGSIVNVASIGGVYHCAGAAYSSAKAGVVSLTKNLAIQYYGSGIRCNSVSPGSTLTPLFNPENLKDVDEEMMMITKRVHYHPIDEMLKPIEQANAILFFASDESSGVNGQDLVVDYGGRL